MVATEPFRELDCQPRLAGAASSGQRQKAAARSEGAGLGKLGLAADEAGELDGQTADLSLPAQPSR
ncbi:MAG TPA: hypothetical protein VKI99_07465 [Candidatus Dormibacteraeota bacterium]|nr:hypothetical protein [Candidatus Dormibacteraeota bacterium]